jgi:hypothetical protein
MLTGIVAKKCSWYPIWNPYQWALEMLLLTVYIRLGCTESARRRLEQDPEAVVQLRKDLLTEERWPHPQEARCSYTKPCLEKQQNSQISTIGKISWNTTGKDPNFVKLR